MIQLLQLVPMKQFISVLGTTRFTPLTQKMVSKFGSINHRWIASPAIGADGKIYVGSKDSIFTHLKVTDQLPGSISPVNP